MKSNVDAICGARPAQITMKVRTIISTAICVALFALWIVSRGQARVLLIRAVHGHALAAASGNGGVAFLDGTANFDGVVNSSGELRSFGLVSLKQSELQDFSQALLDQSAVHVGRIGIDAAAGPKTPGAIPGLDRYAMLKLPYWLVLLVAGCPVAFAMRRGFIRWRRKRKGRCLACGYDLRMSAGRCPECGTAKKGVTNVPQGAGSEF